MSYGTDQPHLIEGNRPDPPPSRRNGKDVADGSEATVINHPATGRLQASFAPVAKHYGVKVVPALNAFAITFEGRILPTDN